MTDEPKPLPAPASVNMSVGESTPAPPVLEKDLQAVALKYDRANDPAPRMVAKGRGAVAEQILELAFAHGIKVREDADLVEILGKLDLDSPIPLEAYTAVAEILSYVYKANSLAGKRAP